MLKDQSDLRVRLLLLPPPPPLSSASPCFTMNEKANVTKELNARHRKVPFSFCLSFFHPLIRSSSDHQSFAIPFLRVSSQSSPSFPWLLINLPEMSSVICFFCFNEFALIRYRFGFFFLSFFFLVCYRTKWFWIWDAVRLISVFGSIAVYPTFRLAICCFSFVFFRSFCCLLRIRLNSGLWVSVFFLFLDCS